jgi:light-regulated signal transduction histidine kinase (bacteriophytochrome)
MIFKKFIGWIIGWIKLQVKTDGRLQKDNISFEELQKKIRELELLIDHMAAENEELQTAFFRNVYHEIRTPMNSILGFSALLHNENLTLEKRNNYSEHVWKSSVLFLQFIDDLVEASLLETKKTVLVSQFFCINDMLQEVYQICNRHRHIMDKNEIVLLLNKTNFIEDLFVETDRKRLIQMLECMISYCMLGMERGIIELGYKTLLNRDLNFCIRIKPFKVTANAKESVVRNIGSTDVSYGLQLRKRVSDKLMELFGGNLSVENTTSGAYTYRILIKSVKLSHKEDIETSGTNKNKIAI